MPDGYLMRLYSGVYFSRFISSAADHYSVYVTPSVNEACVVQDPRDFAAAYWSAIPTLNPLGKEESVRRYDVAKLKEELSA